VRGCHKFKVTEQENVTIKAVKLIVGMLFVLSVTRNLVMADVESPALYRLMTPFVE
jgi:hypothetical protein